MKRLWTIFLLFSFGICLKAMSAEVTTEVFELEEWGPSLNCHYQEFPLSIHEEINPSSIDSVVVTISGISSQGSQTVSQGDQWRTFDCWDGFLVRFDRSCEGFLYDPWYFSPDGLTDYIAGSYVPTGDNEYFEATVPILGLERSECCSITYTVTESSPDFESIFSQDNVYVGISSVSGGPLCQRCMGGLATIESISVSIIHGGGVPNSQRSWESIKAFYR